MKDIWYEAYTLSPKREKNFDFDNPSKNSMEAKFVLTS